MICKHVAIWVMWRPPTRARSGDFGSSSGGGEESSAGPRRCCTFFNLNARHLQSIQLRIETDFGAPRNIQTFMKYIDCKVPDAVVTPPCPIFVPGAGGAERAEHVAAPGCAALEASRGGPREPGLPAGRAAGLGPHGPRGDLRRHLHADVTAATRAPEEQRNCRCSDPQPNRADPAWPPRIAAPSALSARPGRHGFYDGAIQILQRVLERSPESVLARLVRGDASRARRERGCEQLCTGCTALREAGPKAFWLLRSVISPHEAQRSPNPEVKTRCRPHP